MRAKRREHVLRPYGLLDELLIVRSRCLHHTIRIGQRSTAGGDGFIQFRGLCCTSGIGRRRSNGIPIAQQIRQRVLGVLLFANRLAHPWIRPTSSQAHGSTADFLIGDAATCQLRCGEHFRKH